MGLVKLLQLWLLSLLALSRMCVPSGAQEDNHSCTCYSTSLMAGAQGMFEFLPLWAQ